MTKNKATVGVVVHNEESTLVRCLDSFQSIVDEIIIVHDGQCSDQSLEIANRYTKKVYVRDWKGTCEGHFNFIKDNARNDWIIIVDADEYFSDELREKLPELLSDEIVSCYELYWPTCYRDRQLKLGIDRKFYKRVMFRKKDVDFKGYLHESRKVSGIVKKIDIPLIHRPSSDIFSSEYLAKKVEWAKVGAKMRSETQTLKSRYYYLFKAPIWFIFYVLYYLIARAYLISGRLGINYALTFAKYNFYLNIYLYKIANGEKI